MYKLFILPFLFFLVGCHSGHYAMIDYKPMQGSQVKTKESMIVQLRITDSRERPTVVGDYTSYRNNMITDRIYITQAEKKEIYATTDPALILEKAMITELSSRGFTITERSNADVIVEVDLRSFYNRFEKIGLFRSNAIAQIKMNVKTLSTHTEKTDFAKSIAGDGIYANIFYHDGRNASVALQSALEDGVQKLFQNQNFLEALQK